MKRVLELFERLTACKRSSGEARQARKFIEEICRKAGAKVAIDHAGNVLATVGEPKICLQAHYDMVSLGDNPPKIVYDGDWLRAANGTLGADNGIGAAAMLDLIERGASGEYLFTADEEIGMIGANYLKVLPTAKVVVNLDGETEGEIIAGCAGGEDWLLRANLASEAAPEEHRLFLVSAKNCAGGHSGVDIHKPIPNAIQVVARFLATHFAKIVEFKGGERLNAIPSQAAAIAYLPDLQSAIRFDGVKNSELFEHIAIEPIEDLSAFGGVRPEAVANSDRILAALTLAPHGVLGFDPATHSPSQSCNFATVAIGGGKLIMEFFARANADDKLKAAGEKIAALADLGGFAAMSANRYSPWKSDDPALANRVAELMRANGLEPRIGAIHAGLECGVLKAKLPNAEFVSIGATIESPHSFGERVNLPSVERFVKLLDAIMKDFS